MIARLILILLVLWLLFSLARYLQRLGRQRDGNPASPVKTGKMVQCDYCGTHLPAENAITDKSGTYCCEEHRRQHR